MVSSLKALAALFLAGVAAAAVIDPRKTTSPEPRAIDIPTTWQSFPAPHGGSLVVIPLAGPFAEQVVQTTLSGIITRASSSNSSVTPLWLDKGGGSDAIWRDRFTKRYSLRTENSNDLWAVVRRYRDAGVVKGFVLYNEGADDNSSNIATSLCSQLGAIAVSTGLASAARAAGLRQLADARGMSFADLVARYGNQLSRSTLGLLRNDVPNCRDMIVAQGAPVGIDFGGGYEDLLKRVDPAATVIGYGKSEDGAVHSASVFGAGLIAADWMTNWNTMSLGAREIPLGDLPSYADHASATVQDDGSSFYVALVMTDGDNVQWVMGDFPTVDKWYGAPDRGAMPFTWGLPFSSLGETLPDALGWFAETAKPADKFTNYGDPYLYIDSSSNDPDTYAKMVAKHQQWAHQLAVKTTVVFCENWQAPGTQAGVDVLARADPALDAAFLIQYSSYAAGRGHLFTGARPDGSRLPVLMALTHLWDVHPDSPEQGGPQHIADVLNGWAQGAKPIRDRVAWVPINAWSNFDMGNGRSVTGYAAARELANRLGSNIKLVTLPDIAALLKNNV